MGRWSETPSGRWQYDENGIEHQPYPPIHEPTRPAPSGFETDDGSWYARADPDDFPEVP